MFSASTIRTTTGVPCALALAIFLGGSLAHADEPDRTNIDTQATAQGGGQDEAAKRFARGLELYRESAYSAALTEFRRAYALVPNYKLLYNIGQVCFQLQNYACALQSLEQYLAEGGADVPAARRTSVDADIAKLRTRVGKVSIRSNVQGATIYVDDAPVGKTPLDAVVVTAGTRKISASFDGKPPLVRSVSVASEETSTVEFDFSDTGKGKSEAGTQTSQTQSRSQSSGVPSWPFWAGTIGLAAGAGIAGALALRASSDLSQQRDTFGVARADLDATSQRANKLALATDILAGAAVVCGGIALYTTLTSRKRSEGPSVGSNAEPVMGLRVDLGGVKLTGSF